MKKIISLLLIIVLMFSLVACNGSTEQTTESESLQPESETTTDSDTSAEQPSEDDLIEDEAWDELESLGEIESENGLFFATITVPADLLGEEVTQADLDMEAGKSYISAILNEDGSATYKMTKKQHREMLDGIAEGIEDSILEMIDDSDYSIDKITHNKDFTSFDVHLDKDEVGLYDSFAALAFYMYGGIYGIFSGKDVENIEDNYYSPSGELISTGNSSDAGE